MKPKPAQSWIPNARRANRTDLNHKGARTVVDKALPLDLLVPNAETIEAMKEARGGNLPRVNTVEELLEELNAAD